MSVTLTDPAGQGVDFVKTTGNPNLPPQGCNWFGSGIELCTSFVYRDNAFDNDSASDWKCTGKGTLKLPNSDRQKDASLPPLTILPLNGNTAGGGSLPMTITIDATTIETGKYEDEIVIYHNDPSRPSPLRIPCVITVTEPTAVLASRQIVPSKVRTGSQALLVVAPNPVQPRQMVTMQYIPEGNERHGEMFIYNNMGDCLHHEQVSFSGVSYSNKKPMIFSWLPKNTNGRVYRQETCLVRLVVTKSDGSRSVVSTKIGLR
jgi:hypothetical protein